MPDPQQGHDFRGYYLHEDNGFATSPNDTDRKPLGANARIDQAEGSNNAVQVFNFGSRVPTDVIEMNFEGAFGLSFEYTNPWWLNFLYGSPSTADNADGSYTHTWSGEEPQSQAIFIGREGSSKERVLRGCVATQVSVSSSVTGPVQVSITGAYAEEEVLDKIESQPSLQHDQMLWKDASLAYDGSTLGYVQDGSLSLNNNIEMIYEWGSRPPIDQAVFALTPTVDFTKINEAGETTNLQDMYGGSSATSVQSDVSTVGPMTLTLDNGVSAGSGINNFTAGVSGSFPNSYAESGLGNPNENVNEEINRLAESVSIDATNETQTAL